VDKRAYSGFRNSRHTILGRRLQPYSLGHAVALRSGEWEGVRTIAGVLGFLRICAAKIGPDGVPVGFPDKLGPSFGDVMRAAWLMRVENFNRAVDEVNEYLADHCETVETIWPVSENIQTVSFSGCPLMAEVIEAVSNGIPFQTAWALPRGYVSTWNAHAAARGSDPTRPRPQLSDPESEAEMEAFDREFNPHLKRA